MQGLHLLAEFHQCRCESAVIYQMAQLRERCIQACIDSGLSVMGEVFHQFDQAGVTGAVLLAESHLAIHTWPELGAVTLDIYVCNFLQDNSGKAEHAFDILKRLFDPAQVVCRRVLRGES